LDNKTEQLADGVWRVEVGLYVNAFVLANDGSGDAGGLTVVDTGWRSGGSRLVRSIRMLGLDPRAVGDVLLSHCHADHAGSAARFASSSARSRVWAGAGDLAAVRGEAPEPLAVADRRHATRLGRLLGRVFPTAPAVPDAQALNADRELDAAGGLRVVAAPGHTPGHVAFLLPARGVLLAGDAVWNVWFASRGPRFACADLPAVPATLARLAGLDYDVLAVAHGPPVTKGARQRVASLAG
jgi:glyoxylase-like metal-dependent hydrolase (beta-lactamase superfamily II)